ncbi:hypothetical protein L0337_43245 [candidate division KSB1 bacterium]|nr:hypothetical protein [candidate division KSB1 bacterium]
MSRNIDPGAEGRFLRGDPAYREAFQEIIDGIIDGEAEAIKGENGAQGFGDGLK